jgi:hypothetical protein
MTDEEKADVNRAVQPRYWVEQSGVDARLADKNWDRGWLLGFRDITNATNERTVISSVIPRTGVGHTLPLCFAAKNRIHLDSNAAIATALLSANFSALVLDYIARVKVGGTHLTYGYFKQFPILPPQAYSNEEIQKITRRSLELTFTNTELNLFYLDITSVHTSVDGRAISAKGTPWQWDPTRRAILRSELDAIYARLYGLTRDDLRYILDPSDIMGDDYPSETFKGLKSKEIRHLGEYRTRRLVLEAWDKMEQGEL